MLVLLQLSVPVAQVPLAGLPKQKGPRQPSAVTLPQDGPVPQDMPAMPPIGADPPMLIGLTTAIEVPMQNTPGCV